MANLPLLGFDETIPTATAEYNITLKMGFTDYFLGYCQFSTTSLAAKSLDRVSGFGPSFWAKSQWRSVINECDDAFPSSTELHVLKELFTKFSALLSKEEQRRVNRAFKMEHRDSFILPAYKPRQSRSSSCSSTSSIFPISGVSHPDSVELHTLCVLLGEHINKMACNASYWSWAVDCFSNIENIYNLARSNNNSYNDSAIRVYILVTTCLLTTHMCQTLSSQLTTTTGGFDLPPLSKSERTKINAFLTDKVLPYILFLVETEGSDEHHLAGECVEFILAHIDITPSVVRNLSEVSEREKLFQYPRFRHLRIWRYMWFKVILERLVLISDKQEGMNVNSVQKATVDELCKSFANEQDSYVRDHSEFLFDCSLDSRAVFEFKSSVDQAESFLLGLNSVVDNLSNMQRSTLTA